MDVFAITCLKHICYIEANIDGTPFCPKGWSDTTSRCETEKDWNIFQSHNSLVKLTEHVRNAIHELNGVANRLKANIQPDV